MLCWLGMHDWECVKSEDPAEVAYKIRYPDSNVPSPVSSDFYVRKYVCLNCGEIKDEIAKEENKIRKMMEREARAKELLEQQ